MRTLALLLLLGMFGGCASTGPCGGAQRPVAMVTGYWPPTNEMLRAFAAGTDWEGANWRGLGYDVYAFFPEFPPDGDPTNDAIGEAGSVGDSDTDFPVDYQETSADFWRIADACTPRVLITTSRGGAIGWELEAVEGGHGGSGSPETDWSSDRNGEPLPSQGTVDPRSWAAISTYRSGNRLPSALPLAEIQAAVEPAAEVSVAIDPNTSGNYLSGFMGLHGLYYQRITDGVVAAGHIHVGRDVSVAEAERLFAVTLETVLQKHPTP
ncbi:MAG: hypothetical protein AAGI15_12265 [Pseudomonadota bacterium]